MGRGPRSFRGAKQSWVAAHDRFVTRNSHGSRPTVVSWRETVMDRDPRSFRDAKQSWIAAHDRFVTRNSHGSRPTVVSWRETVMDRGPRSFRDAKESWIATHGRFVISRHEIVMGLRFFAETRLVGRGFQRVRIFLMDLRLFAGPPDRGTADSPQRSRIGFRAEAPQKSKRRPSAFFAGHHLRFTTENHHNAILSWARPCTRTSLDGRCPSLPLRVLPMSSTSLSEPER